MLILVTFELTLDTDYRYSDLIIEVLPFSILYKPPVPAVQLNCMKYVNVLLTVQNNWT